jgi:hypothetical protein
VGDPTLPVHIFKDPRTSIYFTLKQVQRIPVRSEKELGRNELFLKQRQMGKIERWLVLACQERSLGGLKKPAQPAKQVIYIHYINIFYKVNRISVKIFFPSLASLGGFGIYSGCRPE